MQDPTRTLWFLKKIPLLGELGPEGLARLAERVRQREVRRRGTVYAPGDPGDTVMFVNGGRVKVSKVTRDGKSLTLGYCGPSELFGEGCLVDGEPRTELVEAVENALITEVGRADFERLLSTHAALGAALARLQLRRRRDLEAKLEGLVFRDVSAKLAELLLRLGSEFGVEDSRGTMLGLKITHQELANLIGSTRETVSLTLSQFKRSNYICTDGRKVIIANAEALRALL